MFFTGCFVLVEMIVFQKFVQLIPQAVFSGVLIKIGYDVFDFSPVRAPLQHHDRIVYLP
jgi:SulP family sulfate permease